MKELLKTISLEPNFIKIEYIVRQDSTEYLNISYSNSGDYESYRNINKIDYLTGLCTDINIASIIDKLEYLIINKIPFVLTTNKHVTDIDFILFNRNVEEIRYFFNIINDGRLKFEVLDFCNLNNGKFLI